MWTFTFGAEPVKSIRIRAFQFTICPLLIDCTYCNAFSNFPAIFRPVYVDSAFANSRHKLNRSTGLEHRAMNACKRLFRKPVWKRTACRDGQGDANDIGKAAPS